MPFERYFIPTTPAPPRHPVIGKFAIDRDPELCRNCGRCTSACVYGVHERKGHDERAMADPIDHLCRNCFRCIQICPSHALKMRMNPEYIALGDEYWEPHRFWAIWYEAENGRIPVFGAGYRGPFGGMWFDDIWTDMSEIVRPTRDGIHGRESISTAVDIGRRPPFLEFDQSGQILTEPTSVIEIQIPILFDLLPVELMTKHMTSIMSRAAAWLGTLAIIPVEECGGVIQEESPHVVPLIKERIREADERVIADATMIEIVKGDRFDELLREIREISPGALITARTPISSGVIDDIVSLCDQRVDVAHLCADPWGLEYRDDSPRHLRYTLKELHQGLVDRSMRDEISLIVGGGIAAAEHVPKAIILGADMVAINRAAMIAMECRLCSNCTAPQFCQVDLVHADQGWAVQRIVNVVGAWRDQLLEVMGAMGIRDVRRLRGETGRAMFAEELEKEVFAPIFGRREP